MGTLRYAINDAPSYSANYILLDTTRFSGSGQSDLFMLIPTSLLGATVGSATTAMYFYTEMGGYTGDPGRTFATEATAEQWANFILPGAMVPEPAACGFMAGVGLIGFGLFRRPRR